MARLLELTQFMGRNRRFFAKLGGDNTTGSLKDWMVEGVIRKSEESGKLRKGMTIVEASSGNTGISLAKVGRDFGYKVVVCVSSAISPEKRKLMHLHGAEVLEYDTSGKDVQIDSARQLGSQPGYFHLNQFSNPFHAQAYYDTLGAETIEQLDKSGVTIDVLVAGVGTGASIIGLGRRLRENHNERLKIYGVGPEADVTVMEGLHPGHTRSDFEIWANRPSGFETGFIRISDGAAIDYARKLNLFGYSAGVSSGALLTASLNHIDDRGNYLMLFGDNSSRYKHLLLDK